MAEVNIDEEFTKKLEDFYHGLDPKQQEVFLIALSLSAQPETLEEMSDQLNPQGVFSDITEPVIYATKFWGGVAGHFAGGGGWPPPFADIAEASGYRAL
jgi:hypothetical protein